MAIRLIGCGAMNRPNGSRDSFLRNTTDPSAAAPCSWNKFFARSTPMMLTYSMDALSFNLCFDTTSLAHRDAVGGERHPPHLWQKANKFNGETFGSEALRADDSSVLRRQLFPWVPSP
jgi:hypothetical protein